jgi:hypothetical protein
MKGIGGNRNWSQRKKMLPTRSVLGAVRLRAARPSQCSRGASWEGGVGAAIEG